mgnify:FL=1
MPRNGVNMLLRARGPSLIREINAVCSTDSPIAVTIPSIGKNILVISVSAGSGHIRAAEALCAHAQDEFSELTLRHRDLMRLVPAWFRKVYTDLYLKLASGLPEAWGWLYRKTDREPTNSLSGRLRRLIQHFCGQTLLTEIEEYAPDAIICTHFLPAELLADATRRGVDVQRGIRAEHEGEVG